MVETSLGKGKMRVWDLPVRLFHWTTVVLLIALYLTGSGTWAIGIQWHMYIGGLLAAVLLFRIIWGVVGSDTARFANFVKGPKAIFAYLNTLKTGGHWAGVGHNPVGTLMMLTLIGLMVLMVFSGLFTEDNSFSYPFNGAEHGPLYGTLPASVESLLRLYHQYGIYVIAALACVHIGSALFYKYGKKDDIITPMITGVEPKRPVQVEPRFVSNYTALIIFIFCVVPVYFIVRSFVGPIG